MRDLEPFVCIFAHCVDSNQQEPGSLTFETSKAWTNHLQNAHGSTWECRAPSHDPIIFEKEMQYQEHSRKEHGVPEAHVGTLSSAARRPVINKVLECPFGDDFQAQGKVVSSTVFSSEALHLHVAAHMKEIALLALQKLPSDVDDDAENVDSDQPSEDNGLGFAKLRGSMYSVLDDDALDLQDEAELSISNYHEEDKNPSVERLDLEDRDATGMTKFHKAVQANDLVLVRSLIDQGENLHIRAYDGKTALHYATLKHSEGLDMMRLLLDAKGAAIVDLGDENGQTSLHYAAERDFTDGMQLMIDRGGDATITDNNGFSPFLWAVVAGKRDSTRNLLDRGVNVNSTSVDGKSALGWAASLGYSSIARLLIDRGANVNSKTPNTQMVPLEEAAACGDILTAQLLIESDADPNYRDHDGWSAIHWAAEEGHLAVVQFLLNGGAIVDTVSSYGTSPLHCAANGGHKNTVSLLLQRGADPGKSTCHGWTPLHHAAFMGHSDVVQILLEDDRTDTSDQDNHGWSILHLAVHSRDLATVVTLFGSSVITDALRLCDESGLTAGEWLDLVPTSHLYKGTSNLAFGKSRCCRSVTELREAVVQGNIPMIGLLLGQGHSVNGTNSGKRTALYYAAKKGLIPIMNILLARGADPNVLPAGRTTWEEFISNNMVISRLEQAGYRKQTINPEAERQIRHLLGGQGGPSVLDRSASNPPTRSSASTHKKPELGGVATNLWKRLRG